MFAVMAAFNEAKVIRNTVEELIEFVDEVIVVDDGASDATGEEALCGGATVLTHHLNLGQGGALQTGIDYALLEGADLIVTFDADGQHEPKDIGAMLAIMDEKSVEAVLGSRFLGEAINIPLRRRLFLRAAMLFTNLTTGVKLTDAHNGMRLLSSSAARRLRITRNRMAHASQIVEQIGSNDISYAECPVTIRYTDYSLAKGQKLTGSVRILGDLMAGWLAR